MPRPRAYLVLGMLVTVLVAGAVSPAKATGLRGRMLDSINRVRDHHDLRLLRINVDLSHDAHRHSRRMANRNSIFHTADLASRVRPYGATSWGRTSRRAARSCA